MDIKNLQNYMSKVIKETDFVNPGDKDWLESIVHRNDNQIGYDQLMATVKAMEDYNLKQSRGEMSLMDQYLAQKDISAKIWSAKIMYYKQPHVMIACAQRKKHPKVDVPNLYGLLAPQNIRVSMQTCFGKGYCESRNYFVQLALDNPGVTHILFVDDDILFPLHGISTLLEAHLPVVSGVYLKRNPLLESTVTTPKDGHPKYGITNHFVDPSPTDNTPVPIGCVGLGLCLVEVDLFKKMAPPYFQFVHEQNPDGSKGRVVVGEDSFFIQKLSQMGYAAYAIPSVVGIHVDLKTGKHYGPEYLVDPVSRKLRPEYEEKFTKFAVPPQECYTEDIDDVFKGSKFPM